MRLHIAIQFLLLASHLQWSSADILQALGIKSNMQMQLLSTLVETQVDMKLESALKTVPNKVCAEHLREYAHGIKHLSFWALKMLDSTTKIPQSILGGVDVNMGNYDECVDVQDISTSHGQFSGKHCLVRVCSSQRENCTDKFRDAASVAGEIEKKIILAGGIGNIRNLTDEMEKMKKVGMIHIGMCVPSTCSSGDLETFLNQGANFVRINVVENECHTSEGQPLDWLDIFTITFLVITILVVVCSTVYDLNTETTGERRESFLIFSAHSNFKRIMDTSSNGDTLQCLHGLKAISILWIICGQRYMNDAKMPLINKFETIEFAAKFNNILIMLTHAVANTFLLISGLLLSYGFFNRSTLRSSFDFKTFYLHRYVRLTPVLAVTVLLQSSLLAKIGAGPVWEMMHPDDCGTSWWHSLLYIKNYLMPPTRTTCVEESWYLSVDTQLYCMSPLLLIPLWKNPRRSRQLLAVVLFLSWFIPFMQSFAQEITMPCRYLAPAEEAIKSMNNIYFATHSRASPWVLGFCLGYILHRVKTGQFKVRINKVMVAAMWTFALLAFLFIAIGTHNCLQLESEYSRFQDAFLNASANFLWGLAIVIVIFTCTSGYGGPVNDLLSMEMWIPISRLSYCMYLVAPSIQLYDTSVTKSLGYFAHSTAIAKYMADLPICAGVAMAMALMFEQPMLLLEKYLRKESIDSDATNKLLLTDADKYRDANGKEKGKSVS